MVVSICCITYNQEQYIAQTINSLLEQKVTFNYEIVIADDASIDNTPNIITEYKERFPDIIVPILRNNNIGMNRNLFGALKKCKGKYIAFCEGDDYWNDPLKLQKQIDFLENNSEYGLVHTNINIVNELTSYVIHSYRKDVNTGYIFNDLLHGNFISTVTVCFRTELLYGYTSLFEDKIYEWNLGDYPLWLYIAYFTKIGYLSDVTAVYRVHKDSVTDFKNSLELVKHYKDTIEIIRCVINRLDVNQQTKNEVLAAHSKKFLLLGIEMDNFSLISLGNNKTSLSVIVISILKIKLIRLFIKRAIMIKQSFSNKNKVKPR